jgi:hypothetical protein
MGIEEPIELSTPRDIKIPISEAQEEERDILTSNQVMHCSDFDRQLIVKADASLASIGYILTQKFDGKEKVISNGSKKLSSPEQKWSTYDREFFALLCGVRANAHYLRHTAFLAITDHRPLLSWRKVDKRKDPTGRRTRWAIELDTYEFELVHKKGKIHMNADALSRRGDDDDDYASDDSEAFGGLPEANGPDQLLLLGMSELDEYSAIKFNLRSSQRDKLRLHQERDILIVEVKELVKKGVRPPRRYREAWFRANFRRLVIKGGILYRKALSETINSQVLQAVIPDSLVGETMEDMHESKFAGHPSKRKMVAKLKRYAIWPNMGVDVAEFVTRCAICDKHREPRPGNKTPLQPIIAEDVFDHVICDLLKLPNSPGNVSYLLVFKDVFSGYIALYKLRDKTSVGVAKAFEDMRCRIGTPRRLTSDNGGEFCSEIMKGVCKVLGVQKSTSVAYRPESQGPVERQNRRINRALTKSLQQYGRSWVDHLEFIEWSYNTTPISKTGMSPYYVFYGREPPPLPSSDLATKDVKDKSARSHLDKRKERVKAIHEEARRPMEKRRAQEEESYNRKAKHVPYEEGDMVYTRVPKKVESEETQDERVQLRNSQEEEEDRAEVPNSGEEGAAGAYAEERNGSREFVGGNDGTFTTRKGRRKAGKTEREERFRFTRKTESKEEKLGAAEITPEDENSEVEADSDYEASCVVPDQQKLMANRQGLMTAQQRLMADQQTLMVDQQRLMADQQTLMVDQQRLMVDQQRLMADQQRLIANRQKLRTDPVKDQTGVGSNKVPRL